MAARYEDEAILDQAVAHAHRWPESVPGRRVPAAGMVMPSAGLWHGRTGIRFSASSWRPGDLELLDMVARAAREPARSTTAVGE